MVCLPDLERVYDAVQAPAYTFFPVAALCFEARRLSGTRPFLLW
jgi:hypothetical protein